MVFAEAEEQAPQATSGPSSQPKTPQAPPPPPPSVPLASTLVEPFFTRRAKEGLTSHHDMSQERGTLRRFLEVSEDKPVDRYGRGDVSRFLDTPRRLPTTYGKSPKDRHRSLAEIIAEAEAKGASRIGDKTVKRHLSALAVFFRYAMDQGHITRQQREELIADHAFKAPRGAKEQRDAWTSEELRGSRPGWWCRSDGARGAERGPWASVAERPGRSPQ